MQRKAIRIGDLLVSKNLITPDELEEALRQQKEEDYQRRLGTILVEDGYLSERQLSEALAEQLGYDFVDLFAYEIDSRLLASFPLHLLEEAHAIPFREDEIEVHVATSDPLNYDALEALERLAGARTLVVHMAPERDIRQIFQRIEIANGLKAMVKEVKREVRESGIKEESQESAVLKLIRLIIRDATLRNASDIHIEPDSHEASVRVRIDGVLRETFIFDLEVYGAVASRIKILGNLDISERRKAQDGRFELSIDGHPYDFRLSTTPTLHGESIVMRILDRQKVLLRLGELGFQAETLRLFEDTIRQPYGIVLLTGPTGSGKTTTLYAALNEIKSIENKVMTVEDPIEYQLPLIQQVQVNERVGFTFATALRSFLRQDPDIIMVGEIRDKETLDAAAQAALTGHLVLSTLHTNDAPGAINRMVQMGLAAYLIADALLAIVAQRLVRRICPYCRTETKPHRDALKKVERWLPEAPVFYRGRGCPQCEGTGFLGRTVIAEILRVDEEIAQLIADGATKLQIERMAESRGLYRPMIRDGVAKALEGITTLEEILRVTRS